MADSIDTPLAQPDPAAADRSVSRVVRGMAASDGAGVRLVRVIGGPSLPDHDPFLMLDAFGSDDPQAYIAGFPDHPHRGFETVTIMLAGRMRHWDNKGNSGDLGPGDVQWMTAGAGLVHSEMPLQQEGLMQGFQLWINLPAAEKMRPPEYHDIPAARIPEVELGRGAVARVIAGTVAGIVGPAPARATRPLVAHVRLAADAATRIATEPGHAALVYVHAGAMRIGDARLPIAAGHLAVLGPGAGISLAAADGPAEALALAARPLGEPVVKHGPFVMTTAAEIRQAIADYHAGRL